MKYRLAIALLFLSPMVNADVYITTDKDGHLSYSDVPINNNSKKIEMPAPTPSQTSNNEENTITHEAKPEQQMTPTQQPVQQPYTITIVSPTNQETIHNQPTISVNLKVTPELQPGDKIQLFLDGNPFGEPLASTHFELNDLDRGQHSLSAAIISNQNSIKQTEVITIYNHRANLETRKILKKNGAKSS